VTTPSPRPAARVGRLAAILFLLPVGCGLDAYEAKMSSEAAKIERLDREAKYLGEPLAMPKLPRKEKGKDDEEPEQSWEVFLRPPRGVNRNHESKLLGDLMAVYKGSSGACREMYLGIPQGRKEFVKDVLGLFPAAGDVKSDTLRVAGPGERDLAFTRHVYDDSGSTLAAHFFPANAPKVAIVYRVAKGQLTGETSEAVKVSLSTLALDNDAGRMMSLYNRQKPKAGKR
jgi:hypothetical protein